MSKALIISKENCGYCTRVRNLLDIKKVEFIEKKLDKDISRNEVLEIVGEKVKNKQLTFPQVYINDEYIGGYTDVCKLYGINA